VLLCNSQDSKIAIIANGVEALRKNRHRVVVEEDADEGKRTFPEPPRMP
jgi:hypothetical protein